MNSVSCSRKEARATRRRLFRGASATALAAGLALTVFVPAPATAQTWCDRPEFAAHTQPVPDDWHRVCWTDDWAGDVSLVMPKTWTALPSGSSGSQRAYGTQRNVVTLEGETPLWFRGYPDGGYAPYANRGERQTREGALHTLRSAPLDIAHVVADDQHGKPRAVYWALVDDDGVRAGIGVTNQKLDEGEKLKSLYGNVTGGRMQYDGKASAFYSFGDYDRLMLDDEGRELGRKFENLDEARAYMDTEEFKTKWDIVNSLQVTRRG